MGRHRADWWAERLEELAQGGDAEEIARRHGETTADVVLVVLTTGGDVGVGDVGVGVAALGAGGASKVKTGSGFGSGATGSAAGAGAGVASKSRRLAWMAAADPRR